MFQSWQPKKALNFPSKGKYSSALNILPKVKNVTPTEVTGLLSGWPTKNLDSDIKEKLGIPSTCSSSLGTNGILADLTATKPVAKILSEGLLGQRNTNDVVNGLLSVGVGSMLNSSENSKGVVSLLNMAMGSSNISEASMRVDLAGKLLGSNNSATKLFSDLLDSTSAGRMGSGSPISPGLLVSGLFGDIADTVMGMKTDLSGSGAELKASLSALGVSSSIPPNISISDLESKFPSKGKIGNTDNVAGKIGETFKDVRNNAVGTLQNSLAATKKSNVRGSATLGSPVGTTGTRSAWLRIVDGESDGWKEIPFGATNKIAASTSNISQNEPLPESSTLNGMSSLLEVFSVDGLFSSLTDIFGSVEDGNKLSPLSLTGMIKSLVKGVMGVTCGFFSAVGGALSMAGSALKSLGKMLPDFDGGILDGAGQFGGAIGSMFKTVGNLIGNIIDKATCLLGHLAGFISRLLGLLAGLLGNVLSGLSDFLKDIAGLINCGDSSERTPSSGICSTPNSNEC